MKSILNKLEPQALWQHFENLNAIPRASKKEEQVIEFMLQFGHSLGLETMKDKVGNVIIKKPASIGMESKTTLVLQSHLDMVHQKNANTPFDFATQGIEMEIDGDWVKAKDTTLGADNGIGVATIMALLSATNIQHPALEALFTIDEETGMTGAMGLEGGLLQGKIMLNLDTEDDHELCIGCAGGIDVSGTGKFLFEPIPAGLEAYQIKVSGLTGGHSGMDIHLGRANANKLMNRLLRRLSTFEVRLAKLDGGSLRNAIPRESIAVVLLAPNQFHLVQTEIQKYLQIVKEEYRLTDPLLNLELPKTELPKGVLAHNFQDNLIKVLYTIPNGIYRMTPGIEGLVQSSNNLARVIVNEEKYEIHNLTRSSVDSEKLDLADMICASLELLGATTETKGAYPGWTPKPDAPIVQLMINQYKELFGEEPHVNAVHAGLECGILGKNYPAMQMISFGPNIRGAHSPDEKVQISSVQKFWKYLLATLENIPAA